MFLLVGHKAHNNKPRQTEVVTLYSIQSGTFFWSLKEVIAFLRKQYESDAAGRQQSTFRDWLTWQSANFVVFFMSPNCHPKMVDWNEIKAIVKEMEPR